MKKKNSLNIIKNDKYYLVSKNALPLVIKKVIEVKDIMIKKNIAVKDAVDEVGISRSSFYKYKNLIFTLDDFFKQKDIVLNILTENQVGVLSRITKLISDYKYNIKVINQSIPVNGENNVNVIIEKTEKSKGLNNLINEIKKINKVKNVNLISGD